MVKMNINDEISNLYCLVILLAMNKLKNGLFVTSKNDLLLKNTFISGIELKTYLSRMIIKNSRKDYFHNKIQILCPSDGNRFQRTKSLFI